VPPAAIALERQLPGSSRFIGEASPPGPVFLQDSEDRMRAAEVRGRYGSLG